ncbi:uncharacterized protein LOC144293124 [Canis aureus]
MRAAGRASRKAGRGAHGAGAGAAHGRPPLPPPRSAAHHAGLGPCVLGERAPGRPRGAEARRPDRPPGSDPDGRGAPEPSGTVSPGAGGRHRALPRAAAKPAHSGGLPLQRRARSAAPAAAASHDVRALEILKIVRQVSVGEKKKKKKRREGEGQGESGGTQRASEKAPRRGTQADPRPTGSTQPTVPGLARSLPPPPPPTRRPTESTRPKAPGLARSLSSRSSTRVDREGGGAQPAPVSFLSGLIVGNVSSPDKKGFKTSKYLEETLTELRGAIGRPTFTVRGLDGPPCSCSHCGRRKGTGAQPPGPPPADWDANADAAARAQTFQAAEHVSVGVGEPGRENQWLPAFT